MLPIAAEFAAEAVRRHVRGDLTQAPTPAPRLETAVQGWRAVASHVLQYALARIDPARLAAPAGPSFGTVRTAR